MVVGNRIEANVPRVAVVVEFDRDHEWGFVLRAATGLTSLLATEYRIVGEGRAG